MNSALPTATGAADSLVDYLLSLNLTSKDLALYGILAAVLPFLYTYIVTTLNDGKRTKEGEPPVPPYAIPFVGHAIAMASGQEQMINKYRKQDGRPGMPRTLYMFGQTIYLLTDPTQISIMWRKSKTLSFAPMQNYTYRHIFGGTKRAAWLIDAGLPGVDQAGLEGRENFLKTVHDFYHHELSPGSEGLTYMTRTFMKELIVELNKHTSPEAGWVEVNLFAWVKKIMFPASGRALYGYKLKLDDDMATNFWRWDGAFLELAKMYPDFMIPGRRAARQKVVDNFINWRAEVIDKLHDIPEDVPWEENFGCRLVRQRVQLTERCIDPDDLQGHATLHNSFFWALEANAIPTAAWVMVYTILNPEIFKRVGEEVAICKIPATDGTSLPSFDFDKLREMPFMNAVWQESMRLGVSSMSPRIVIEDTEIDGYMFKKGGMVQGLGQVPQTEEAYWGKDVNEFKPERWLQAPGESPTAAGKRIREQQAKIRPFGGGASMCPGRHFASSEVLATLASLIDAFEWDLQGQKVPRPDKSKFGAGGLPPLADVKVKLRRK